MDVQCVQWRDDVDQSVLRDMLRELIFAQGLADAALDRLAQIARVAAFPAGNIIFREGAANETLYLIHSGHVALDMAVPARGRVRLLTLGPGDLLGWSPLLGSSATMTASAIAVDATRAVALDGPPLRALCESDHEVGFPFVRQVAVALSRRLLATRLQLLDLFADPSSR